jgi:hypothetical protein
MRCRAGRIAIGVRFGCLEPPAVAGTEREALAADIKLERARRDREQLDASCVVRLALMRLARSERPCPQFEGAAVGPLQSRTSSPAGRMPVVAVGGSGSSSLSVTSNASASRSSVPMLGFACACSI